MFCAPVCRVNPVPEPELNKPSLGPLPLHLYPTSPVLPYSLPSSSGNGKRASSSGQQTSQTPPQQQCQLSSASARYPPREVPPRFRQQEHKQLLKRGQPLPVGALGVSTISSSSSYSTTTTNSVTPNSTTTVGKHHSGLFHTSKNTQKPITMYRPLLYLVKCDFINSLCLSTLNLPQRSEFVHYKDKEWLLVIFLYILFYQHSIKVPLMILPGHSSFYHFIYQSTFLSYHLFVSMLISAIDFDFLM